MSETDRPTGGKEASGVPEAKKPDTDQKNMAVKVRSLIKLGFGLLFVGAMAKGLFDGLRTDSRAQDVRRAGQEAPEISTRPPSYEAKRPAESQPAPVVLPINNSKLAHEIRDANLRWVGEFLIGLLASGAIIGLVLWGLFDFFATRAARSEPPRSPLVKEQPRFPPEPRLQMTPGHDIQPLEEMMKMRAAEGQILNSYDWVDQPGGVARIPIEQAMKVLAERGLPSRPPSAEGKIQEQETELPEVSSSGRTLERRPQ